MGFSKHNRIEYQRQVWALRLAGNRTRAISDKLGISLSYVKLLLSRAEREAREEIQRATVDHAAESQDRLSIAMAAIWDRVQAGDLDALRGYLQLEDRRAKLLGLDAATKLKIGGGQEGDGLGSIPIVISPAQAKV